MPMERINSYRARKQREVDREMAARQTRQNLAAAVAEQGFVVADSEAALLGREAAAAAEAEVVAAAGSPQGKPRPESGASGSSGGTPQRSGSGGGHRWVSQLQKMTSSIGGKAKDSIDRGRIRIAHRRVQSLGAPHSLEPPDEG